MANTEITYQREDTLHAEEFIDILKRSTLGQRRPIDDIERIKMMCQNGDLFITARHDGKLVGIARSLSDFAFCTYLSDLAVDEQYQRQGIGIRLIKETKLHSPLAKLILLAAPAAVDYYPKTGMTKFAHCFLLDKVNDLKA
ncbi:GNAT family N-acetyltransferase [Mucilaginibacter psychrotolerans]|uniref:GNAT family N-acetyltransferase n=1 Tax=Mucilaginibacter psychrotolerans TaxID=1524096 RepID=A0A4Y8SCH3_9SPHI|nr:GNAT family N-acetyltransferase [Mucilaginibacter psychrotolerans]TFF36351.1 GNAT family N-acetyltransferase [Mucilaginibacter psychrotolerans]